VTEVQVFLVRHGETALNAAGVLRGQLDVPLDATGEAEALALGALFREVPLSAVVSSPLRRATDTARPIASSSGAPVEIDDRLRDRYYGKWAGHSLEQVEERFGSVDAVPFVEARRLLEARVEEAFLDAIAAGAARSPRGTPSEAQQLGVVLVTHDAVIRTLLGRLLPALNLATVDLPTGSWTQLVSTPTGGWEALHLGEIPTSGRRPTLSA
jgi:broad specificity phosphatase PhoE